MEAVPQKRPEHPEAVRDRAEVAQTVVAGVLVARHLDDDGLGECEAADEHGLDLETVAGHHRT